MRIVVRDIDSKPIKVLSADNELLDNLNFVTLMIGKEEIVVSVTELSALANAFVEEMNHSHYRDAVLSGKVVAK